MSMADPPVPHPSAVPDDDAAVVVAVKSDKRTHNGKSNANGKNGDNHTTDLAVADDPSDVSDISLRDLLQWMTPSEKRAYAFGAFNAVLFGFLQPAMVYSRLLEKIMRDSYIEIPSAILPTRTKTSILIYYVFCHWYLIPAAQIEF
jgi:hypothetical protein